MYLLEACSTVVIEFRAYEHIINDSKSLSNYLIKQEYIFHNIYCVLTVITFSKQITRK